MGSKDHFISRGWLEQFTNESGRIYSYNIKLQTINGPFLCKNTGFERDFWSFSLDTMFLIDELYGTKGCAEWIDGVVLDLFKKPIPIQDLTPQQRQMVSRYCDDWRGKFCENVQLPALREFINIAQKAENGFTRVEGASALLANFLVDEYCWGLSLRKEIEDRFNSQTNEAIPEGSRKRIIHDLALFTQLHDYVNNNKFKNDALLELCSRPWIIIRNKTHYPFVLTDRPVMIKRFMTDKPKLQLVPLSKDVVVLLGFGDIIARDSFLVTDMDDPDIVRSMNTQISMQSFQQVFC